MGDLSRRAAGVPQGRSAEAASEAERGAERSSGARRGQPIRIDPYSAAGGRPRRRPYRCRESAGRVAAPDGLAHAAHAARLRKDPRRGMFSPGPERLKMLLRGSHERCAVKIQKEPDGEFAGDLNGLRGRSGNSPKIQEPARGGGGRKAFSDG
jgi:hypothetical protein